MSPGAWHAAPVTDRMTRLVVDSPSLFYRAFFALPKSIKGPDGNSVNAVRGYLDMVSRVLVDRRPRAVAVGGEGWTEKHKKQHHPQNLFDDDELQYFH